MKTSNKIETKGITRREALKVSGMALGGIALGGTAINAFAAKTIQPLNKCEPPPIECPTGECSYPPTVAAMNQYSYYNSLPTWYPKVGDPSHGIPET